MTITTNREGWVLWTALAVGMSGILLAGCAHDRVRAADMSATAHREQAQEEYARADRDLRLYDPSARTREPASTPAPHVDPAVGTVYNPTAYHLANAEQHAAHAQQHLAAAAELERFTDQACKPFSASVRAACPVLGPIASVEDIRGGVRVHLQPGLPVDAVLAHMRCHLAYARERGWQEVPDCPLYVRGIDIRPSTDGRAIEIVAHDGKTVDELRRRAHAELHAAPAI